MDWEQRALSQTLFGPASFTKKSPKPISYDPVTHLSKKFSYENGQYSLIDRPSNPSSLSMAGAAGKGYRSRMAQSGEFIVSQQTEVQKQYRFFRNRMRTPGISPITGLRVEMNKGKNSPEPLVMSLHQSLDLGRDGIGKITGAMRKPVANVAYVSPFAFADQ